MTDEELGAIGASGKPRWMERLAEDEARIARENEQRKARQRRSLAAALESLRKKITGGQ